MEGIKDRRNGDEGWRYEKKFPVEFREDFSLICMDYMSRTCENWGLHCRPFRARVQCRGRAERSESLGALEGVYRGWYLKRSLDGSEYSDRQEKESGSPTEEAGLRSGGSTSQRVETSASPRLRVCLRLSGDSGPRCRQKAAGWSPLRDTFTSLKGSGVGSWRRRIS
jgi:hypothetical protein